MDIWLSNFVRVNGAKPGMTYRTRGPYRFVLHTTETRNLGTMPQNHQSLPQLWVDPNEDKYIQCIPLNLAGYALKHPDGTVDTNRIPCIQVEIAGYAGEIHNYSDDWYKKLAKNVIKPVCDAVNIDYHIYKSFKGEGDGILASASSSNRMSDDEWLSFNGICGHQHVPNNDHWDPGRLDFAKIIQMIES